MKRSHLSLKSNQDWHLGVYLIKGEEFGKELLCHFQIIVKIDKLIWKPDILYVTKSQPKPL